MKKLTEEQRELVEKNINLVYFTVNKFFWRSFVIVEKEELYQEGMFALCKCIPFYDSKKGEISTYIVKCVKKHLSEYMIRKVSKHAKTIPLEKIEETCTYYDTYNIDVRDSLKEFLDKYLKEKPAKMAYDHYVNNMEWQELAEKYGYADRKAACAILGQNMKRISESKYLKNKYIDLFI